MLRTLILAPLFAILAIAAAAAEMPDLSQTPLPAGLLALEAKVTVAAGVCFLEGPPSMPTARSISATSAATGSSR